LIYSTANDLPRSCVRTVNGTVTYEVIGWHTTIEHIGYLAPMLFVNLASLIVIIIAMNRASGHASADDPTKPTILLVATRNPEGKEPNDVTDKVVYSRRDVRCVVTNFLAPSADLLIIIWLAFLGGETSF
jgi:hypothetical protein